MDCTNARFFLNVNRPGELDETERRSLDEHLEACPDCAQFAQAENHFDETIGAAMLRVPVPAGLKTRLLDKLSGQRRPRPWKWVAAAAAILVAAGLGGYFIFPAPQEIDDARFAVSFEAKTPEDVETWYQDLGIPFALPRQFNFQQLNKYDTAVIQGRKVPHLVFFYRGEGIQRPAVAHVYVLPTNHFKKPDKVSLDKGTLDTLDSENGDFFFLILHTGDAMQSFLLPAGA